MRKIAILLSMLLFGGILTVAVPVSADTTTSGPVRLTFANQRVNIKECESPHWHLRVRVTPGRGLAVVRQTITPLHHRHVNAWYSLKTIRAVDSNHDGVVRLRGAVDVCGSYPRAKVHTSTRYRLDIMTKRRQDTGIAPFIGGINNFRVHWCKKGCSPSGVL